MPTSILFEDEVLTALESLTGLGLENFDDVQSHTNALSELRNKISNDGLSKETFIAVESLHPNLLSESIKKNRCTELPSTMYQNVALELLDGKITQLAMAAGGVAATLTFFKVIEATGKHFQSNKFEMDLDISAERFRRSFKSLKDAEDEAYSLIWDNFADIRFAFQSVAAKLVKKSEDNKGANDVYRELKRYLDRKVNIFEAVSLMLLARFCVNYEAAVQDFTSVADQLLKFPTYSKNKALTTGLAITRSGISGKLLLKTELGFDAATVSDLSKLARQVDKACHLLANPSKLQAGEKWLEEAKEVSEMLDVDGYASLVMVNDALLPDSPKYNTVLDMRQGRIGFWHNTEAHPQGDVVIAPQDHDKEIAKIFNLATIQEAVRFKDEIRKYSEQFRKAVAVAERSSEKAVNSFVTNYPEVKGEYRALTNQVRNSFTTALRVSNVMINYCEGYVDMIGYCKNLNRIYEKNVPSLLGIN